MGSNPGKDTPAQVSDSLDMLSPSDRRMILSAQKRWGLDPELKAKCIKALDWGIDHTMAEADERGVRGFLQIAAAFEGQNQSDEHFDEKNRRADDGKADSVVEVRVTRVEKTRPDGDG